MSIRQNTSDALNELTWKSSDGEVVMISDRGKITALKSGNTMITAVSCDGKITASCEILVADSDVKHDRNVDKEDPDFVVPDGLWITGLDSSFDYTGAKIVPKFNVYYGNTLLREKVEYTVSYKDNINAGIATIIISGKGNYSGKCTKSFVIKPLEIEEKDFDVEVGVYNKGKSVKPVIKANHKGTSLKLGRDYTCTYEPIIEVGQRTLVIEGYGNYTGFVEKTFYVKANDAPSLKIAKIDGLAKTYTLAEMTNLVSTHPGISVVLGTTTVDPAMYELRFENCDRVGKGTIVAIPTKDSPYVGEKRVAVTIMGIKLGSMTLSEDVCYNGISQEPDIAIYTGKGATGSRIEPSCYDITYSTGLINAGTITVTATGRADKGYTGKLTAKFKILRRDITDGVTVRMPESIYYTKGGAKPVPLVTYKNEYGSWSLREGIDYTIKYADNNTVDGKKSPTFTITGKGNFIGNTSASEFTIQRRDISILPVSCADIQAKNISGVNYYRSKPVIYDTNGQALKENKDYTVRYINMSTGSALTAGKIPSGTKIRAEITAKGNYLGTTSVTYTVIGAARDIKKSRLVRKIPQQYYTGRPVELDKNIFILTYAVKGVKENLVEDRDYIVTGYYNNINKGTASFRIEGRGNYSGSKIITFKIVAANNALNWKGAYSEGSIVGFSPTSISLSGATIEVGRTIKLEPIFSPDGCDTHAVTWKSSNTKVATVDKYGNVTAKTNGNVTIYVTSVVDKKIQAATEVKVSN